MIQVKNLVKIYGNKKVVDDVSLNIEKGKITSFIGPNGAGKSTTMKIVSGLLLPDSGEVYVDEIDAIKNNKKLLTKQKYSL